MNRIAEILALLENPGELTDEQLAELDAELVALADGLADNPDDDALEQLEAIAAATELIRTEAEGRETSAAERSEQAAALLERIRGEQAPDDGEPAAEEQPAEEQPAPEAAAEEVVEEPAAEPVAAASVPNLRAPLARVAARRPAQMTPRAPSLPEPRAWGLVASANVAGFTPGERLDDPEKIARAFAAAIESTRGYRHGPRVKVPVARTGGEASELYPDDRFLDGNTASNMRKIAAVTSQAALTASGGICAPQQVRYDLPVLGDDDRPFRDGALARFGADRGGITTIPPPQLAETDGAIGIWTEANDQNPSSPATKPCLTFTCPDEDTTVVDAITMCLEFGTFRQRFFPEQIEAWMTLAAVNHARRAETKLMTAVGTGSTHVSTGQVLGASRDVLTVLDRAVAQLRSFYRLSGAFPLRFVAPFWLRDMMRSDLAREMPGSSDERLATADATIESFIAVRNVNVTWVLDGESGQVYGPQGDGPLQGWKSTVVTYLYPEGSWLFLDGGSLDLGIVRDTTTIATNDVQMFSETFENVHFHGNVSWRLTLDLCPDGTTSGTADIDPCSTGS